MPGRPASGEVTSLALSRDGEFLFTGSDDRTVKVWDLAAKEATRSVAHDQPVYGLAVSVDGKLVATGAGTQTRIYRVQ